jgi:type IV secretory pathway VirB4 component
MSDTTPAEAGKKKRALLKSTVRNRQRNKMADIQRYIPFAEIRNDTVIMKNGGLRAVLRIEPLNFNLKSETEQQGIIAGYESFINTITFPLQIVIRSSRVNIEPYLNHIHSQAEKLESDLLKEQALAYGTFIEKIVDIADIMQKEFYVVIPLDDVPRKKGVIHQFLSWIHIDDTLAKALQRNKQFTNQAMRLKERIDLIETGLNNVGIGTKRLNTMDLIRLYYRIYNPISSKNQKLPETGEFNTEENVL